MAKAKKIWIADDDESIRFVLESGLAEAGFNVCTFEDGNEVVNKLDIDSPNLLLTDLKMPGRDGMDLLETFKNEHKNIPVIIMTAHSDLETTVEAFEAGAWDYIAKPFDLNSAIEKINKAMKEKKRYQKKISEKDEINLRQGKILGKSPAMQDLFNSIGKLSHSNTTVLLVGESGTGKELVSQAIFEHSDRSTKKLISLNVADIPVELLESELFGHEKGAFKGAGEQRIGRFEQADNGTLFLDEVGDMPLETQTRLIRVLSSGEFYRIGGNSPIKVDVRIIAATNQNLEEKVKNRSFREDLYHRLNVIKINLPPLRDRKEDILLLANYFLKKCSDEAKVKTKILSPEVEELFENLIWPGNVLQLQNVCQSLTLLSAGQEISISDIPKDLSMQRKGPAMNWDDMLESWASKQLLNGEDHLLNSATPIFETTMIKAALKATKGKKSEAAKLLGWGRNTLSRKITELGI
tara:strand:+ start:785 stop:2182 length:1398 start_codon:yes stop_codon:yes gene_type:complete